MNPSGTPPVDIRNILARGAKQATRLTVAKGDSIFAQGEPADSLLYVHKGRVKITVVSSQGKEAVIALLDSGVFLGEGCLAGQPLRMASAVAMADCVIIRLAKAEAIRLLHEDADFSGAFLAHVITRNIRIEEDLVDQLFNSSEKRLARALLLLTQFGKNDADAKLFPQVTHETLAEMVGTTRSRITFFMNKFRKLGLIEYNGGLVVRGSLLNVVLHD